ncbi:hypothetical protein [Sphingomonas prati]|uniref:Uncharacterized protein n=1 Tax=Sphingomonas prati TaxID=1843237 RepID=A0A7W9BRX4_9SPHN|nr:hypothetical protein [Sphingomonas prati]MBB5729029.1 hypothetical protein [Sphingomonas prati]
MLFTTTMSADGQLTAAADATFPSTRREEAGLPSYLWTAWSVVGSFGALRTGAIIPAHQKK